jgi:hypothetical protein
MTPKNDYVPVAKLENIFEAQLVESVLKEENVPFRIRSFHDTAYDGLFQTQKGWGEVWAPESFKDYIIEIIENIRSKSFHVTQFYED